MVEYPDHTLDRVFSALSDPTRRKMLEKLQQGEATVSELASPHDMTIQAVSKHVRVLEGAGLVQRRREGREVYCRLRIEPMQRASSWLDEQRRFWEVRLDRLEQVLRESGQESNDEGSEARAGSRGPASADESTRTRKRNKDG